MSQTTETAAPTMDRDTLVRLNDDAMTWVGVHLICNGTMFNHEAGVLRVTWESWDEEQRQAFIAEARDHLARRLEFEFVAEVVPAAKVPTNRLRSGLTAQIEQSRAF